MATATCKTTQLGNVVMACVTAAVKHAHLMMRRDTILRAPGKIPLAPSYSVILTA